MTQSGEPDHVLAEATVRDIALQQRLRLRGNAFLAVCGNILFPGCGHALTGRPRRGAIWAAAVALPLLALVRFSGMGAFAPFMLLAILQMCLSIGSLIDGFIAGRRSARSVLPAAWQRFTVGVLVAALALVIQWPGYVATHYITPHVEAFAVKGESMTPNLKPGDMLFVAKGAKHQRWDVVVYRYPEFWGNAPYLSRIAGLPGETVQILNGQLTINGRLVEAPKGAGPYASMSKFGRKVPDSRGQPGNGCQGNPIVLGPDEYFLLSDNPKAVDSRLWELAADNHQLGALPQTRIIGVAKGIYWPPARYHSLD